MKNNQLWVLGLLFSFCLGVIACKPVTKLATENGEQIDAGYIGKKDKRASTNSVTEVKPDNAILSLANYLRRVPGVSVSGSGDRARVYIRGGIASESRTGEPLFVLDGVPIGDSYSAVANRIVVNDIDKISVLKDISASSMYGVQGQNGVILIKTKRN
ncbi:MAG: TonB-dependent receptor plug domain-containing protein [Bacteroidota bacterium]